ADVVQLSKLREHMILTLGQQPNYTCTETIERSHRSVATRKFRTIDTLRLEVALVAGKEMFGWPGARKFEDVELRHIVPPGGAIGNGNFALPARAVFEGNVSFKFRGEERIDDRDSVRYDFSVPLFLSGYKLRVNHREAIVAYHGSVWANPESLDLEQLEVIA